jgi:hypothetical protein
MKHGLQYVLLLFLIAPSCETSAYNDAFVRIRGSWQWLYTCGGFAGGCWSSVNTLVYNYRDDGVTEFYRNDTLVRTYHYYATIRNHQDILQVQYSDSSYVVSYYLYFFGSDSLIIDDGASDGYTSWYKRVKK